MCLFRIEFFQLNLKNFIIFGFDKIIHTNFYLFSRFSEQMLQKWSFQESIVLIATWWPIYRVKLQSGESHSIQF